MAILGSKQHTATKPLFRVTNCYLQCGFVEAEAMVPACTLQLQAMTS